MGLSALEVIACGGKRGNAARLVVPSGGSRMDATAVVDVVAAVAVARERNQAFWRCELVLVACHGRRDSGGTSNDTKRTLRQETAEKHRGKPRQPARSQSRSSG